MSTTGSPGFDPDRFFGTWSWPADGNLVTLAKAFGLGPDDDYVYRAMAEVRLGQVQHIILCGRTNGLHGWYDDFPPPADVEAYCNIFSPETVTSKSLTSFKSNAKKDSIRQRVAAHLLDNFQLDLAVPRNKNHVNPYLDVWKWTCRELEWAGPDGSVVTKSHALLPVMYHHFGCVVPTHDAVWLVQHFARKRTVVDMGSGNGYWTCVLRRAGVDVLAVDDETSLWRTMWITDTIKQDGVKFLNKDHQVLLLVYPQVGGGFTERVLRKFAGDTIICVGTQNANGYTGFASETIAQWMGREMGEYEKVAQVPLPSFAGKDEALYVFCRGQST